MYIKKDHISWRLIEDRAYLVDRDEGELLELNPVGTEIWQALDGSRDIGDVVNHVCQTFDVSRKKAEKDTVRFIERLKNMEIIEKRNP